MYRSIRYILVIVTILLLGQGCVTSSVTRLSTNSYRPTTPAEVKIFVEYEDLPVEYEKVALINVTYSTRYADSKWKRAREKAAKLGCNGVYERYTEALPGGETGGGGARAEIVGIRY